jgi:hypothetical protein
MAPPRRQVDPCDVRDVPAREPIVNRAELLGFFPPGSVEFDAEGSSVEAHGDGTSTLHLVLRYTAPAHDSSRRSELDPQPLR